MDARSKSTTAPDVEFLKTLFNSIDQGFCLCEAILDTDGCPRDYRFLAVNSLFEAMTGLSNVLGRTALELVPNLEPFWVETYGRVAVERSPVRFQRPSSPMGRWFDVAAAPFGEGMLFVVVFRDITAEKRAEKELAGALVNAEALLQELNHRVMNSLGMIVSIIGLESRARDEGAGRLALQRIATRVHAVGDLYRTLGQSQFGTEVRADDYLGAVVDRLAASIAGKVRLDAEIEPVTLPTRLAAPLGLMVNELVTNSLKYAFEPEQSGSVSVSLRRTGPVVRLAVADDGKGLTEGRPVGGIGRQLVAAFAQQIEGELCTTSANGGTVVTVDFPLPKEPCTGA